MSMYAMIRRATLQKHIFRNYSGININKEQAAASLKLWKIITFTVVPVALTIAGLNVYLNEEEEERPEFIKYDYLRIRTKRFPWGDGNKTLFHNPKVNALPDGYEDEI